MRLAPWWGRTNTPQLPCFSPAAAPQPLLSASSRLTAPPPPASPPRPACPPPPAADTEAGILQGMRSQRRVISTPLPDAAVSREGTYNNLFGSYIILIGALLECLRGCFCFVG